MPPGLLSFFLTRGFLEKANALVKSLYWTKHYVSYTSNI